MKLLACMCVLLAFLLPGCGRRTQQIDPVAYRHQIEQWRQERLTRITSETGWLTLCGLYWLKEGPNKCGSDSSDDIILPAGKAPSLVGTFWLNGSKVRFAVRAGVEVRQADSLVSSLALKSDVDPGGPTILTHGSLSFFVIKRGDKLGVRVKDKENPARANFKGLEYFPIDPGWRIEAKYEPYTPPHVIKIVDAVNIVSDYRCPGALVFEHSGKTYRLDAFAESDTDKELFIMFGDQTNGIETYGAGRQLYTDTPGADGRVVLDFNKAYNWPCVFTEYATCPIPPRQNNLPLRVESGEKMYALHQ